MLLGKPLFPKGRAYLRRPAGSSIFEKVRQDHEDKKNSSVFFDLGGHPHNHLKL
jgi:hypothetical protein